MMKQPEDKTLFIARGLFEPGPGELYLDIEQMVPVGKSFAAKIIKLYDEVDSFTITSVLVDGKNQISFCPWDYQGLEAGRIPAVVFRDGLVLKLDSAKKDITLKLINLNDVACWLSCLFTGHLNSSKS